MGKWQNKVQIHKIHNYFFVRLLRDKKSKMNNESNTIKNKPNCSAITMISNSDEKALSLTNTNTNNNTIDIVTYCMGFDWLKILKSLRCFK